MTDQTIAPKPEGQATPPGQTGVQPAPQAPGQQVVLSRSELDALLKQTEDRAFSRAQGLYEKGRSNFEQKVQAELATLKQSIDLAKASGVTITPEQEHAMKTQAIARAYETLPQANQPGQAAQPPAVEPDSGGVDPVTAQAWALMEQAGIIINEEDPEAKLLDLTGEAAFLASVQPAIQAKARRLAGIEPGAPPARTPTNIGGGGGAANDYYGKIHDPDEIWNGLKSS
jgi:hypothetical protein